MGFSAGVTSMNTGLGAVATQQAAKAAHLRAQEEADLLREMLEEQRKTNKHLVYLIRQLRGEND